MTFKGCFPGRSFSATALLAAAALLPVTHAQDEIRTLAGVADDAATTLRVRTELDRHDRRVRTDIRIETFNGTVRLTGPVATQQQIDAALSAAESVSGVNHVQNEMVHAPEDAEPAAMESLKGVGQDDASSMAF